MQRRFPTKHAIARWRPGRVRIRGSFRVRARRPTGSPARIAELPILEGDQEYGPVAGLWELREAIAGYYNETFRRGLGSKYSAENVAVSGGGRSALTRVAASRL